MIESVLVANRGEIARRIFTTLKTMGIRSVALVHAADADSVFHRQADEVAVLEGEVASSAYLDIPQIIEICRRQGADAVHPGYGFLAENADFAAALAEADITFIGPEAETMRLMGDKIASRDFVAGLGVPVAPSATQEGGFDAFIAEAGKLGYPLLIKAAAGGGGRGMSIVRDSDELQARAAASASEAERYFGDGRVYAERYVERPRHIEVQVLGDGQGNCLHLFERECSVQRRYQKIIEETPAANLEPALCAAMCGDAVRIATEVNYRGAGTVEFMVTPEGEYFFLEMNTRLQVEHPVTEMVTGIDLVREQVRVATGEALGFVQEDVERRGHAIECRVCAEDAGNDFLPAVGSVLRFQAPEGPGVRLDSGVAAGQPVTTAFDSLLAKLVVHGADRDQAIARSRAALREFVLLGVTTNAAYLERLLDHQRFRDGRLDTGFVVDQAEDLAWQPVAADRDLVLAAAALAARDVRTALQEVPPVYAAMDAWHN
ncbi:MAG TPA: biotin carboxylase N-terminal domain-containing protein [Alphaproteobacteria bacterium]|jgi:propionyl-CoA carboxylase alpha chain/3-methylcrotonyl-CoA carboxylase alpha subunit/acetyl-CoA/propionyl-CoA carboxylase biotin carboxyl carrier protein|nr:biotin carboxylase N-terminal domain-containing protein [Alphaproteobacteria bacterium]